MKKKKQSKENFDIKYIPFKTTFNSEKRIKINNNIKKNTVQIPNRNYQKMKKKKIKHQI